MNFESNREEKKATEPTSDELKKTMDKLQLVQESSEHATQTMFIDQLSAQMANLRGGAFWAEVRDSFTKSSLSDEEKFAIEKTVSLLQAFSQIADKHSLAKRSARNLVDVATAFNALQKLGSASESVKLTRDAVEKLYNALGESADEKMRKEAAIITGARYTEEEFKAAKERLDKFDVS